MMRLWFGVVPLLLVALQAHAASMLRVNCEAADIGAEVTINGQFRGECPVDIQVQAGTLQIRVMKPAGADRERVYQQEIRMGEGTVKRLDVVLGTAQLTAAAQAIEDERLRRAQEEALRLAEEKRRIDAEAARQKAERIAKFFDDFKSRGVEPGNGKAFRDCPECPEMVLIPATDASPVFAVGKYEVTRGQFAAFIKDTGYAPTAGCSAMENGGLINYAGWKYISGNSWANPGITQDDNHPVVCVSSDDANAYLAWLSKKTGGNYRLPPIALWSVFAGGEYGKKAPPPWKTREESCQWANLFDQDGIALYSDVERVSGTPMSCSDGYSATAPVGMFRPTKWGVYDLFGNVSEITADVYTVEIDVQNFGGYSGDNQFTVKQNEYYRNNRYIAIRGENWLSGSQSLQYLYAALLRTTSVGFRVIREFDL